MRQVVHGETELVSIAALQASAIAGQVRADARVVHERIEAIVVAGDLLCELTDLVQRREVGDVGAELRVPGAVADLSLRVPKPFGIPSVQQPVLNFSGGQRQSIAVARAIAWGRRIVILDEPTAALGVRESQMVLGMIRELREHGLSVIMISHNLPEVFLVADRITVLRLGRTISVLETKDSSVEAVVAMMTGALAA